MTAGITDLTTFVLGTIFIVLLPGPNSLYVLAVAARQGVAAGYRGAFGIFAGDFVLMLASATGAASLLRTTPALFDLIKTAGALYLAWIGLSLLRGAGRRWRDGEPPTEAETPTTAGAPFRTAFVISLMNPKAILFFVSFFIQFVDPNYAHPERAFVVLGLIVQACSAAYLSLLIFAGARLAASFRRARRASAVATGGVGAMFLAFGGKLAGATLN